MSKLVWKPAALLAPVPAVFVTCGTMDKPNVFTVAWTGIVCTDPTMTYISVRPQRHSYNIIKESGEFAINLASASMCRGLDTCGVLTGAKVDKFKKCSLIPEKASQISAPIIEASPLSLECKVDRIIPLGTHDMFLSRVVAVDVEESLIDENGKLCLSRADLVAYSHGDYLQLGRKIGSFGYSVRKKKKNTGK